MSCLCGDYDCPSCGPAQGRVVRRVPTAGGGFTFASLDDEEAADLFDDEECFDDRDDLYP